MNANANRRRYQLLRLGVPCNAGRSPRSPAALQRKKRLVFRSKEGGANAV